MKEKQNLFVVKNSTHDLERQEKVKLLWIELAIKNYNKLQETSQFKHSPILGDIL